MQAAIDRVMETFGMIEKLTADEEKVARERVTSYLSERSEVDDRAVAIEGLRYLRSVRNLGIKGQGWDERQYLNES
jgi:hypothetical protein